MWISKPLCVVLGCEIGELLISEPEKVTRPGEEAVQQAAVAGAGPLMVSHHRGRRSLLPM
ncbi:hypothetical protein ACFV1X_33515 [Streptomyces coelicoflavus]|uniref:hypothetical protein n=1 Tax=Streptomyces coelicoflavus TaxID=285562 RepID=UPI0036A86CD4